MSKKADPVQSFTTFLQQQNLENQRLLLMVSGGVDSVVLLHVAAQVVKPELLAVFHLNHKLREEADENENFVQNLCTKLNIKFHSELLPSRWEGAGEGSQEANWRKSRKELSQKVADNFNAKRILTAHHATDLVETMVFRLTKGCGPSGLSPFDTSTKPFWQLPKQALINYALEHQLEWREDHTNQSTKYQRNLIRHQVLPALRKITPNLEKVFVRESQTFTQTSDFLNSFFHSSRCKQPEESFLQNCLDSRSISLKNFLELPPILQAELLRHVAAKIPSQSETEDALKWLQGEPEGNSTKNIGGTKLQIQNNHIVW